MKLYGIYICSCFLFTAVSFQLNQNFRGVTRFIFKVGEADLRKNADLYSEYGTDFHLKEKRTLIPTSSEGNKLVKPEVLSPAGGWPQLQAAVSNGADAVYFGLQEGFNARARASNFKIDELEEVMNYLHDRSCKGYLVVNILVFDSEKERLRELVPRIAAAGVDALIMQDLGAAAIVHSIAPNLPIHGSTQMTITDARGVDFTQRLGLGIDRVVVGRELSVTEISSISRSTSVELEAFVHGALCVSYSGQCFSSEAWGGRSANRGQCAQACRMPYGLMVNGTLHRLIDDAKYLLSPQDLMAVDLVPELIKAGVRSFKIEGRLKGPEYVSITTKAYREAVDEAWNLLSLPPYSSLAADNCDKNSDLCFRGPSEELRRDLRQVFSRGQDDKFDGLSLGFLSGVNHQSLVRGRSPRHRGNMVGKVVAVTKKGISVDIIAGLKRGDGVVFDRNRPEEKEEGGSVYEIFDLKGQSVGSGLENEVSSGIHLLSFASNAIDFSRVKKGDIVWRSKDPSLENRLKGYMNNKDNLQLVPVQLFVKGKVGEPLCVRIVDSDGKYSVGCSSVTLQSASNRPLNFADIDKAVGLLGDTPFKIVPFSKEGLVDATELDPNLFLPVAEIKVARRLAVESLLQIRRQHDKADQMTEFTGCLPDLDDLDSDWDEILNDDGQFSSGTETEPELSVLCRNFDQVRAACQVSWLKEIVLDFLEVHGLREAVSEVKKSGKKAIVATPRILKPDEQRLWTFYLRLKADALLVRSSGFLQQMLELGGAGSFVSTANSTIPPLFGDFSLNAANVPAAKIFLSSGLSRLTLTHDLNADQISNLAIGLGRKATSMIECIIHQHLPIFHTEHCVFCRFLSDGNSYKDCGHPCETNNVDLRDLNGRDHTVLADMGCRNTVFNAEAQSGAQYISKFIDAGIARFRIELVDESASSVEPMLNKYRDCLLSSDYKVQESAINSLLEWLGKLPNRNGIAQGVGPGSLMPAIEHDWDTMKPTAYQKKTQTDFK